MLNTVFLSLQLKILSRLLHALKFGCKVELLHPYSSLRKAQSRTVWPAGYGAAFRPLDSGARNQKTADNGERMTEQGAWAEELHWLLSVTVATWSRSLSIYFAGVL